MIGWLSGGNAPAQLLGANLNERGRNIDADVLRHSFTGWTRAFFDVLELEGVASLANQPDVVGMRRAADAGSELMVSLKWDFKGEGEAVPSPGSARETQLFSEAVQLLQAIGRPVNTVIVGNEPMFETPDSGLARPAPGQLTPIATFTQRLRDHVEANYAAALPTADRPRYLIGALNRLDQASNQQRAVVTDFFQLAQTASFAGLDIHVHYGTEQQAEAMLSYARNQLGAQKSLAVTEFSPVWRYQDALDDPIGVDGATNAFAQQYGYAPTLRVDQYLTQAFAGQVSRQEWSDFVLSQPWFDEHHVATMHALFAEYGVSVATLGFVQGPELVGLDATRPGYAPYHINWLYMPALIEGNPRTEAHSLPYYEDWVAKQMATADLDRDGQITLSDHTLLAGAIGDPVAGLTDLAALALGDLNLDRVIDEQDRARFLTLYVAANVPLEGDYNGDGAVTTADYTVWRDLRATRERLPFESASLGVIDAADYGVWAARFGTPVSRNPRSIPEPSAGGAVGVAAWGLWRQRR